MNSSPEVAMTLIEPGGRRWAQLLNVDWVLTDLLPLILSRLDLPDKINYELLHVRSGNVLGSGDSLRGMGIAPGEELQLRPVRNKLFFDLLDALYGQAVDFAAKELWGQVEARLETLFRLEPGYPDPQNVLGAMAAAGRPVPGSGFAGSAPVSSAPAAFIPPTYTAGPYTAADRPGGVDSELMNAAPRPQPAAAQPVGASPSIAAAKPGRSSCGIVALILGGLVLLALIAAAAVFTWFLLRPASGTGGILPFGDEPELGTGDVQVTLRWDNSADLDLRVTDPAGDEIYFAMPSSASGGRLDVDANGTCEGDAPVENIFWPTGGAPTGTYSVSVDYYGACDSTTPTNYEVTILVNGQEVNSVSGTLSDGDGSHLIGEFSR